MIILEKKNFFLII